MYTCASASVLPGQMPESIPTAPDTLWTTESLRRRDDRLRPPAAEPLAAGRSDRGQRTEVASPTAGTSGREAGSVKRWRARRLHSRASDPVPRGAGGTRTPVAADPGRHDAIRNPDLVEGRRTTDGRARHRERHTGRPQVVTAGTVAVATTPDADVRDRSLAERLPHWNPPGPRPKAGT